MSEKNHVGNVHENRAYYDLITTIMICLGTPNENCDNELLRLLDVLLSTKISTSEKKDIMEKDYNIPMTEKMEEEVESMGHYFTDSVKEEANKVAKEIANEMAKEMAKEMVKEMVEEIVEEKVEKVVEEEVKKERKGIVANMLKQNESIEKICLYTQCDEAYVLKIKEELAQSI